MDSCEIWREDIHGFRVKGGVSMESIKVVKDTLKSVSKYLRGNGNMEGVLWEDDRIIATNGHFLYVKKAPRLLEPSNKLFFDLDANISENNSFPNWKMIYDDIQSQIRTKVGILTSEFGVFIKEVNLKNTFAVFEFRNYEMYLTKLYNYKVDVVFNLNSAYKVGYCDDNIQEKFVLNVEYLKLAFDLLRRIHVMHYSAPLSPVIFSNNTDNFVLAPVDYRELKEV